MDTKGTYLNTASGLVEELTEERAALFPQVLKQVPEGTKPYVPGMFKPALIDDFDSELPPTEEQAEAQAQYEAVIEDNDPRTKAAREAKAALEAADKAAAKAAAKIEE